MGLMTDPKTQATVSRVISKYYFALSVLFYIVGIVYMLSLAHYPLNAGTYFSENALLPALVEREYRGEQDTLTYINDLEEEACKTAKGAIPEQWLYGKFLELGLDVYTQNFTVSHPFMEMIKPRPGVSRPKVITGTNVYGILRAPRLAGTEAIVLTVPYRSGKQAASKGNTNHGIGLMLSLANFFRKHTYWSKDIIFLVVEHEEMGMRAWLESYHDTKSEYITSSLMSGRSGSIMGAINLELGFEHIHHLDIQIEGPNGQLPNLDLINLAVRLCKREGVPVTFQNRPDVAHHMLLQYKGFQHNVKTMLLNMAHQAAGKPRGTHGLFLQYHIEALTLKGYTSQSRRSKASSIMSVGRVLEGMTRSINNLLERLHQSFFFYVLPSTERYVSIGLYMPPFGCLMMVPILHGLALWLASGNTGEKSDNSKDDKKEESDKKEEGKGDDEQIGRPFHLVIPLTIGALVTGVLLFYCPQYFITRYSAAFGLKPDEAVTIGLLAFLVGCIFLPYLGRGKAQVASGGCGTAAEWQLLKSFALIWQGVSISAIAMMNFSLAFFIGAVTIPVYIIVRPSQKRILRILQSALLIIVSPYGLLLLGILLYQYFTTNYGSFDQLFLSALLASKDALYTSVVDRCLYCNWGFGIATLVVFPNWMLFWMVVWRKQ